MSLRAGSGIGRAVCQTLAREGACIIATDRNPEAVRETVGLLTRDAGQSHIALTMDVTSANSVNTSLQSAIEHFSRPPSIVVNNAGITKDNFILKTDERSFQDVIDVNLKGTFLVLQATAKAMSEAGITDGSIINVASIVGKWGNIGQANYSASKAGVEALTKTAAKEFGKLGIRCNAVLPGFIATPMTDTVPENVKAMFLSRVAAGRLGRPEEVAEVITFLASDRSSYVNGASVEVTGG
ncbi:(3R)-3-hydroxyacyl-CoA dehydrogenase isoform X2 [Anabrus simplex]|uniref:(3R)-3-hydroxyacyl-CoA dehydrogenase isoform X2 n=1 Tax=Anabrus simplex TaxID=316456 RepID=UPI0035A3D3A7